MPVDKRTQIAREILSTEKHYVRCLEVLIEVRGVTILNRNYFLLIEKNNLFSIHHRIQKYQKPLMDATEIDDDFDATKQEIKTIFGNIHVLLNVNKQLVEEITTRLETWNECSMIGDVFVDVVC